ncbi:MAG: hypothetical protein ACREFP_00155 [Acetobacteraceae bacterium]
MIRRSFGILMCLLCWAATGATVALADELALSLPFAGSWSGGVYRNPQTQRFDYCAAAATYRSGISLVVAIGRNYHWRIAFADRSWNLAAGTAIPLVVSFDHGSPWTLTGEVRSSDLVYVEMPENGALIRSFRDAYTMTVYALGRTFGFDLSDTAELVPELALCVTGERATPTGGPSGGAANSSLDLAATRIASNLLLAARLPRARLLTPAETPAPLRNHGVAWTSDVGSGAVLVVPHNESKNAVTVASSLIDSAADACRGQFASGRSSDVIDNHPVAKAFTGCKDAGGTTLVRYFVLQAANGAYVIFALVGTPDSDSHLSTSPLADAPFQSAAVEAAWSP